MGQRTSSSQGFTLIELLLVISLVAIIGVLTTVNLIKPQTTATLGGTVDQLVADLRAQQLKAMSGDTAGTAAAQTYGVRISGNQYTLFTGTYTAGAASNFTITADSGVQFTTTLPSATATFAKTSGEVSGFTSGANTITVTNTFSGEAHTITINRLGVVSVN